MLEWSRSVAEVARPVAGEPRWSRGSVRLLVIFAGCLSLIACAVPDPIENPPVASRAEPDAQVATLDAALRPAPDVEIDLPPSPYIEASGRRMQCVPYARTVSGIDIRGDAWTWWAGAERRYHRGAIPAEGSVLVFKRKGKTFRGHVAVVTHVLSGREIVVDHANWLKGGRIHHSERVIDVSPDNDWTKVRVWYTPGRRYGRAPYATYGFIYPVAISAPLNLRVAQKSAGVTN